MSNKYKPFWSRSMNVDFITENFTKVQLEKKARKHGIELDKRKSMKNLMSLTGFEIVKINRYIKVIVRPSNDDLSNTINHDDGYDYAREQIRLAQIR